VEALPGYVEAHPGYVEALPGYVEALPGYVEALPGYVEAHPGNAGLQLELLTLLSNRGFYQDENTHPEAMQPHPGTLVVLF
jgi:hypothetical protein